MNNVVLLGRLTRDVELRYTPSQMAVATFTLAVDRGKDKDGNDKGADFIRTVVYGKQAENSEKYLSKGSRALIQGHINTGSYEKDGKKYYTTDVVADRIVFIDFKKQESAPDVSEQEFMPIDEDIPF